MRLDIAERVGIPLPPESEEIELQLHLASGEQQVKARPGELRVFIKALRPDPFVWPCLFVRGDVRSLLGLPGLLGDVRLIFDGRRDDRALYGRVILELLVDRS